jgi:hypothetical protein
VLKQTSTSKRVLLLQLTAVSIFLVLGIGLACIMMNDEMLKVTDETRDCS